MKIRAIVDGKVMYGQHYISGSGQHYVLINTSHRIHFASPILVRIESGQWLIEFVKIDPATTAVCTGKQDKNGKDIYGSKGDMLGGDEVRASIYGNEKPQELTVQWISGAWVIEYEDSESDLALIFDFVGSLEIIPQDQETD